MSDFKAKEGVKGEEVEGMGFAGKMSNCMLHTRL